MITDPNILLSYINTKLRDNYSNLDALCEDLDLNKEEINNILKSIDYYYVEKENKYIRR